MPRRGRQSLTEQHVFFVTTTVKDHKPLFNSEERLKQLKAIIHQAVRKHRAILFGYVLMSNHFHLLIGLCDGGLELSALMRDIKSMSWRTMFRHYPGIWMPRFDDVAIYTDEQFRVKLNYIHNNPVKAGLVDRLQDYLFSSARAWLAGKLDDLVTTEIKL